MEAPGGVEPPTNGLGNRCSIQLSYGANAIEVHYLTPICKGRSCSGVAAVVFDRVLISSLLQKDYCFRNNGRVEGGVLSPSVGRLLK